MKTEIITVARLEPNRDSKVERGLQKKDWRVVDTAGLPNGQIRMGLMGFALSGPVERV